MANLYEANETMVMLGQQNTLEILSDEELRKKFDEVLQAHSDHTLPSVSLLFEIGIDFFSLGYVMGKRAERKKKKKWLF